MATLFRRGRVWWLRCRVGGVQLRESLRTRNRKVAEELRVRREFELLGQRRGVVAPAPGIVAVEEPEPPPAKRLAEVRAEYEDWSQAHKRAHTIRSDRGRLDAFFATVSAVPLAAVRTADVERFLTGEAKKGRAPATLLRNREILPAFWRWAVRQGHVERNVVEPIPRPRLPERDPRFLSLDQIEELLRAVEGDRIAPIVAVAVFAALRREEICWLTWDDLELDREPALLRVRAKQVGDESWQPKTKRDRKVPVSRRLRAALDAHRASRGTRGGPWLFATTSGTRWDPNNLSARFRRLVAGAKLSWNLLDLRHTFGSQLARRGVSLLKIARLMGNSPAIASKHYINLVPEEMAGDVEF